jgi:methylated-DNA-[protein]-cysteine S-methyltransferase
MKSIRVWIGSTRTTQLGDLWVALSERGLVALAFGVRREAFDASVRKQAAAHVEVVRGTEPAALGEATRQLGEYLDGERRRLDIPIDWSMLRSDFQRMALKAVLAIPYGETRTYGEIAAQIGCPQAPRAVGRANATNPMPLVIPCHRVIGSDGKLHGYGGAGGLKTKQWLLEMEKNGSGKID